jgi:hypothetical protein
VPTDTTVYCANHPRVETAVSCSSCGKPICPDCMVPAPVGIKCRECARQPRSAVVRLRPDRALKAAGGAFGVGTGLGVLLAYAGYAGFGFFTILVAFFVGYLVGRATLRLGGSYRSEATGMIAAAGAAWSYVVAAIVIASQVGGSPRLYVQGLGLLVAAFIAFREAS